MFWPLFCASSNQLYVSELYWASCSTWDRLVESVSARQLKIADLDWFVDLPLSKELAVMRLPEKVISAVHLYAAEALKLQPLLRFARDLVEVVQLIVSFMKVIDEERVKKGAAKSRTVALDKNWKGLVLKLERGQQLKRDQPILEAAKMYKEVTAAIGIEFSTLHRSWLSTLLERKHGSFLLFGGRFGFLLVP